MDLSEFQQKLDKHCDDIPSPERSAYIIMRSLLRYAYSLEKAEKDLTGMISGQQGALAVMRRVLKELRELGEEEPGKGKSMALSQLRDKLRKRCDRGLHRGTYLEIWSKFNPSASPSEAIAGVASMIDSQRRQLAAMRKTLKALRRRTWEES